MDTALPNGLRHSSTTRSFNGCWTCRLRRKKCGEQHPVCDACASLYITCHYNPDKPDWMDGGVRQEEMAEELKREVKEKAHRRRGERAAHSFGDRAFLAEATTGEYVVLSHTLPEDPATLRSVLFEGAPDLHTDGMVPYPESSTVKLQRGADCTLTSKGARQNIAFGRSDTIFLMFYLEHVLPFLFPFYNPSSLEGGRAWILEMMISSPVLRQATLCQSSYFFSLRKKGQIMM